MGAEVAVKAGAVEADKDAETGGSPSGVLDGTIEASFVLKAGAEAFKN